MSKLIELQQFKIELFNSIKSSFELINSNEITIDLMEEYKVKLKIFPTVHFYPTSNIEEPLTKFQYIIINGFYVLTENFGTLDHLFNINPVLCCVVVDKIKVILNETKLEFISS